MKAPSTGSTAGGTLPAKTELNGQAASEQILHYEVRAKLGEGGMGVVYKAVDRKLNRLVALKFLPPQIDRSGVDLERFLQEANALSALNHPHIATIYSLETDGERQFLVLEYLPGGTLKAKLQQARNSGTSLSTEDILKYAQQTAEGLAHAHARGIIHRDVKTSNLMLTEEGDVKVTDFGLAKLTGSSLRTLPGSLMGTIAYMSPEQVLGMEVDARSDAFSFGVSLFELISGRLPFEAPNDAALLTTIANARVPPLREFRPDVPPELERIVGRTLKKRREERYASMGEVLADIRALREGRPTQTRLRTRNQVSGVASPRRRRWFISLIVAALGALIVAAVLFRSPLLLLPRRALQLSPTQPASTQPAPNQLAVQRFRFFGAEEGNEELAKDVTRALSRSLAELKFDGALSVLTPPEGPNEPIASSKQDDVRLRANLVLTGVLIQDRDRLTVAATLRDPKERIVVNAVETQGQVDQLPRLQESLREKVAEILHTKIHEAEGARELCNQGRGYLQRYDRIQNLEKAISLFDAALAREPAYAQANAARAEAYLRHYRLTTDTRSLELAKASLNAAMQVNEQLGPVNFARGLYRATTGDQQGAIESFRQSLEIDSASDPARELANQYDALNRLKEAEAMYLQAMALRPGYWANYKDLAVFYQKHAQLSKALPLFERVAQLAPDDHSSYTNLFAIYYKLRMYPEAAEALENAVSIDPSALTYYQLGTMRYLEGRFPEAIQAYQKSLILNPNDGTTWGALGDAARFVKGRADVTAEAYQHAVSLKEEELRIRPRDARLRAQIAGWSVPNDKKRALREIRLALGLNPNDSYVQALAALVYEQSAMRDDAIAAVEAAIKLGYSVAEIQSWPPLEELRQDSRYKRIVASSLQSATVNTDRR